MKNIFTAVTLILLPLTTHAIILGHKDLNIAPIYEVPAHDLSFTDHITENFVEFTKDNCPIPVVFRGAVKNWPAMDLTPEILKDRYGKISTTCFTDDNRIIQLYRSKYSSLLELKLDQAMKLFSTYTNSSIKCEFSTLDESHSLLENLKFPASLGPFTRNPFLIGSSGHVVHFHHHQDAYLAEFHGRKLVTLFSHDQRNSLQPKWIYHPDIFNPDFNKYPNLRHIQFQQVILEPGDLLFIPSNWYHAIHYLTTCIGIAVFSDTDEVQY